VGLEGDPILVETVPETELPTPFEKSGASPPSEAIIVRRTQFRQKRSSFFDPLDVIAFVSCLEEMPWFHRDSI
jgi:hypothetical protein